MRNMFRLQLAAAGCVAALAAGSAAGAAGLDPAVIEKAKKEGEVVFYTNLIVNQVVRPLSAAFEAKYGIKVSYSRADSQATILKLVNEVRAGRTQVDIWNLSSGLKTFVEAGVIEKFSVPNSADYGADYRDSNGYWVATNVYVNTPGYNTNLVPAGSVPKTYQDLLDPKWKDKLVWKPNDISGAVGFIGNAFTSWGEAKAMEYLQALSKQNVKTIEASARAVLDRVIAGDFPIALQIFNHHATISQAKGAPVKWIPMEPASVTLQLAGITKGAPHPNASLLFIDYMLSTEGQEIFRKAGYLPASPKVPAEHPELKPDGGHFKATVLRPEILDAGLDRWTEVYNQLFR